MAALTTWGADNEVTEVGLDIRFTRKRIYGTWGYAEGPTQVTLNHAWNYTRVATMQKRFVGMDWTTANACAAALRAYYTRDTSVSEWDAQAHDFTVVTGGRMRMADIAVVHSRGSLYDVTVSVNETDERTKLTVAEPSSLFAAEESRAYANEWEG